MKIKKGALISTFNVVHALVHGLRNAKGEVTKTFPIPAGAAAKLGRIERELLPKARTLEVDRKDLIAKFDVETDELDVEGKKTGARVIDEKHANFGEYKAAHDALMDEEVECPYTLKLEDFRDCVIDPPDLITSLGDLVVFD